MTGLFLFIISSLYSCKGTAGTPAENYLRYFENQEYPRIYGLLTDKSKSEITLDEFCTRFENIYGAMAIKSASTNVITYDETEKTAHLFFNFKMDSDIFGVCSININADFTKESGTWKLLWDPELLLPGMDQGDTAKITSVKAPRGEIFDLNGNLLAKNDYAISVFANIDKIVDGDSLCRVAAPLLNMTETEIKKKISGFFDRLNRSDEEKEEKPYSAAANIVVLKSFSKDAGIPDDIKQQLLSLPGIGIEEARFAPVRYYPNGSVMCHTVGYTGLMSEAELALAENSPLTADTPIGKSGLEKKYEHILRGIPGYKMEITDSLGNTKAVVLEKDPEPGSDLWLNIDLKLQQEADLLLMDSLTNEMSGAVVVLDPTTGAIKALSSYPTFDPNLFSFPISSDVWDKLNSVEYRNPLYNRATLGLYPPGSVFKPFTAAIAYETNSLPYSYVFTEHIEENKWTPQSILWPYPPITRIVATPSPLNITNAMIYSDNIFFANAAMETGEADFYSYMQNYGFNESIISDLPVAEARIANAGKFTDIKLLADTGYGQGELLVTPLHMAAEFSAFANDGTIMQPMIINSIKKFDGNDYVTTSSFNPTAWKSNLFSSYTISLINPLLERVVSEGTASAVRVSGMTIYGKTGTAEVGNDKAREIAWFIGFTKDDNPKLVCVMVEVPAGQGTVRYEIAKQLFKNDPVYEDQD